MCSLYAFKNENYKHQRLKILVKFKEPNSSLTFQDLPMLFLIGTYYTIAINLQSMLFFFFFFTVSLVSLIRLICESLSLVIIRFRSNIWLDQSSVNLLLTTADFLLVVLDYSEMI